MILIWRQDTNPATWTEAEFPTYLDLCDSGLNITGCVPVPRPFPQSTINININTRGEPADFFFAGLVFIVSGRLRALLKRFKVNAEFLSVGTIHKGKRYTKKQFYFTNILEIVDCFDYEKSRYRKTKKGVDEITKLVLDDSKSVGHHLFRVGPLPSPEPNPKAIRSVIRCASEELASAVIESGLSGVVFSAPKDRQSYPPPAWKPSSDSRGASPAPTARSRRLLE